MDRDELETEVRELRSTVDDLAQRVEALEESQSDVQLQGTPTDPSSIRVVGNDGEFPIGAALLSKASKSEVDPEIDALREDVDKLKRGEVDREDLVAGSGIDPELPIEEDIAKSLDESRQDDLTANEYRAAHIFRAFGGHCESWSGILKVTSADVRNIFQEKDALQNDPNTNTVKRAMKMLAKKTRDVPKKDRDPFHEDNLLRVKKGEQRLELVADKDEWHNYWNGVEERVGNLVAGGDQHDP